MRKWITPLLIAVLVLAVAAPAIAKPAVRRPVSKAAAKAAAKLTVKKVKVSHPYVSKYKNKVGRDFKTWGYIKPRVAGAVESTVTIVVAKWEGKRSWVTSSGLETIGTLKNARKFKNKTQYKATMDIPAAGRYRMRAVFKWVDSKGIERMKRSSWKYVKVVK